MTRALFVSDIHISSPEDPKCLQFEQFLDKCLKPRVTHLFLVGDIFDFWIADRNFLTHTYAPIIEKIRQLVKAGVRVHYFEGNHDLDLRQFWQHKIGAEVHSEAAFFSLANQVFRVEHGDQMDPDDRGYLFLRWLLRTSLFVWLGRMLPEFIVRWLGRRASLASRDYTTQIKTTSNERAQEKTRAHARTVYGEKQFAYFISGHVHVSEDSMQVAGDRVFRCINLGTWLSEPVVFEFDGYAGTLKNLNSFLNEKSVSQ